MPIIIYFIIYFYISSHEFHGIEYRLGNHPHSSVIGMGADEFCRYRVWLTVPVIDGIAHMGYHFISVGPVNPIIHFSPTADNNPTTAL